MNGKRFLLACLGMALLGSAGLIILHYVVDSPSAVKAQPGGGAPGFPSGGLPGSARQPVGIGQYKELVPALLDALADTDGGVRQLAAATLVKIGTDAVPPLVEALKSKDREKRANAAYVLGQLGEQAQEALPALARTLKDEDKEVRRRAAYALHNIVSRNDTSGASADGPQGLGGLSVAAPDLAAPGGHHMFLPATSTPWDPGLLVPSAVPTVKPEKPPQ